jgi:hypothetical protein
MKSTLMVFALVNIAIFLFLGAVFIAPVANSLFNARRSVALQERRISAEIRHQNAHEENLRELEYLRARGILPHDEMLAGLAEISVLGAAHGLENTEFTASGISRYNHVLETRVRTEYVGDFFALLNFIHDFSQGNGVARAFSVSDIMEENSRLSLDYSLFGVCHNEF